MTAADSATIKVLEADIHKPAEHRLVEAGLTWHQPDSLIGVPLMQGSSWLQQLTQQ